MTETDPRKKIHDLVVDNKIIPVVGTDHLKNEADAVAMAKALYKGGSKVIEFVLRHEDAEDIVNGKVFAAIKKTCPGMLVGVGTCVYPEDIQLAKDAGADFAVSAAFRWKNLEKADEVKLFYLPGVGTLQHFQDLVTGDEVHPISKKTVQELLGGKDIATLKIHPGGATSLPDILNGTVQNPYQRKKGRFQPVALEPSEAVQEGFGLRELKVLANRPNPNVDVKIFGGTFPYVLSDGKKGWRNLIQEKNWQGIEALTRYAMDVTHGRPAPELPENVRLAATDPEARIAK